ncbi:Hypothetical protein FKW44_021216 [Caligus rogercresseyi]|uniref:Uncharacterized protein n=1 Tax=Caligus rogercresseyi TaxID=217165 RepID=A0A7T8GQW8_CALRO|nr:Hypothetical protein FKW44_021216 [Caligus rogercresseyi]
MDFLTANRLVMGTEDGIRNVCGTSVVGRKLQTFVGWANGELLDKEGIEVEVALPEKKTGRKRKASLESCQKMSP